MLRYVERHWRERWETVSGFVCYTVRGGPKADLTHGGASNAAWA